MDKLFLMAAICVLAVNIMIIVRFFRMADDVRRIADNLAPPEPGHKPGHKPLRKWL